MFRFCGVLLGVLASERRGGHISQLSASSRNSAPQRMRLGNRRRNEEKPKALMKDVESQIELSVPVNICRECPPPSAESYGEDTPLFRRRDIAELTFRNILPCDREVVEHLHEEWFPVSYQSEFYDELVQGRMVHSGDPLFTKLATTADNTIVGCVIGSMVKALILSKVTQELLIDDVALYPRLFYIMTLGTLPQYRRSGLATRLIRDCIAQAEQDTGCGTVYLHVLINNVAAIAMYEKLGFYRVQEIPNYYWINDELHNCYLYAKYFHGNRGHRSLVKLLIRSIKTIWHHIVAIATKWNQPTSIEEEQRRDR